MKERFYIITTVPVSLGFFFGQAQILKRKFDVEVVSSSGEFLTKFANAEKVKCHVVDMERDISILKDLKSLFEMTLLFLRKKPNYIHGNTPKAGLISMISGWLTRVPKRIYYVHGLRYQGATGLKKLLLMTMEKVSCRLATHVFSVSQGLKDTLYKDNITNKSVKVIGSGSINGIDEHDFSRNNQSIPIINTNKRIAETDFVYGFVGRLVADKGINELVTAFLAINSNYENTRLVLVGPYEAHLSQLDIRTQNAIEQHPSIIRYDWQSDVRPFYKLMDIFVFPSYREGFGVSLIEALSMEVPVICSNISGCDEIIKDNETGILVRKFSIDGLAEAMISLMDNKKKRLKLAKKGRSEVIRKYKREKVWENTLAAYQSLGTH
ncbi:MAG: glycosyltransferase family 1 protein [Euryarchaeota archaeon]|nr:glycosyltransferase family 1 protein [Euryarchaeota archaeon]|tara:strand:- start:836 stop:1975 length:1140 start_codon:yes stop_codon:yes gene_type:complete